MKKNDSISLLVYVLMVAIVLVVGLVVIRPVILEASASEFGGLSPIVVLLLTLIAGLVVVSILNEVAHIIGAKIGKFKIRQVLILGLGWKNKEGKTVFAAGGFDGLTGETKVVPLDVEKSKLTAYVYMSYLFFLLEIIACVVMIVLANSNLMPSRPIYVISMTLLTIVGVVFLYQVFPTQLDTMNDGYRLRIISNPKNRVAYNQILLSEDARFIGEEIPELEPYEDLTDFTASINSIILYKHLEDGNYDKALEVNEYTLKSKGGVSKNIYNEAVAIKLSLLLLQKRTEDGRVYFDSLSSEEKKYIAAMNSMAALRAYLLVSALLDDSQSETEIALARKVTIIKKVDKSLKKIENKVYKEALELADKTHPDWELLAQETIPEATAEVPSEETPTEEVKEEPKEEEKEDK